MRPRPYSGTQRLAGTLAASGCLAAMLLAGASGTALAAGLHPTASASRREVAQVRSYWTRARMDRAPALDAPRADFLTASASFAPVTEPAALPNAVNGRLFVRQGGRDGFCSATAINSPTRRLVLTAGHCVNTGPVGLFGGSSIWSRFLEFVPAYENGVAPFGAFIAHRSHVYAPKQWVKTGNPNFDVGAVLTSPNAEGINVADAVGGGATVAVGLTRRQQFQTFGFPGNGRHMQGCESPYVGDDSHTYPLPGPPTIAIRCHWAPGASGGGWLVNEGTTIDGLTSYGRHGDRVHTFGPYFSPANVGHLIRGF
ncbi:MAG: hypothetical protein WBM00_02390 [Solirubrobacterales bacterium]